MITADTHALVSHDDSVQADREVSSACAKASLTFCCVGNPLYHHTSRAISRLSQHLSLHTSTVVTFRATFRNAFVHQPTATGKLQLLERRFASAI